MSNPLLENCRLPPFARIRPEHVETAISTLIERNQNAIEELLDTNNRYSWDNLLLPIEELEDELAKAWSPVGHLNAVMNSDELRAAYNNCLPLLSAHSTWMGQHQKLCGAYQQLADSADFASMERAKRTTIEHALRDFRLAGVSLSGQKKLQYGDIKAQLSKLSSQFSDNVLDATNAWSKLVEEEALSGLPETALAGAKQRAEQAGKNGYLINLEFPSYQAVITYCDSQALREEVYRAFATRASSDQPQWDNSRIIEEILSLRQSLATLLGFDTYAELSLATKMADDPSQVIDFLRQLASRSKPQARREWQDLCAFAKNEFGVDSLNAWDASYYSEKMRLSLFDLSQEDIRPYLPAPRALQGLFEVAKRLYGIDIEESFEFESYHNDLRLFSVFREGEVIARFYLDLYARPHKRGGAWMDDARVRRYSSGSLQLPVAYLVCNFTPPVGGSPALLSDDELLTLFHEFGHGLHHMLTTQSIAAVSGINGVAWDAVELPSQFMENWCWEKQALEFITGHFETGSPLPENLLNKLLAAKNFHSAMAMVRQLEFSLFDFRLHLEWGTPNFNSVQSLLDEVRNEVAVVNTPPWNRFQNAFSHIFGGGYAAGYYSYKWAEVLSADAFSMFEEKGIFNRETGAAFQENILETGGSRDAMESFVAFRGREPNIEPLLRHCGITV